MLKMQLFLNICKFLYKIPDALIKSEKYFKIDKIIKVINFFNLNEQDNLKVKKLLRGFQ